MREVSRLPRIFVDTAISIGKTCELSVDASHYLKNVMRLRPGFLFRIFNGRDGEFLAQLDTERSASGVRKSQSTRPSSALISEQLRCMTDYISYPIQLVFAPIKKPRMKLMLEKVTELGASHLVPVITKYTDAEFDNVSEGLSRLVIEASEQSERLDVPQIASAAEQLEVLLQEWIGGRLFVCRERFDAGLPLFSALTEDLDVASALEKCSNNSNKIGGQHGVLVGPEGGFSIEELDMLGRCAHVRFVSLGAQVLRSETAAISAMAVVAQAASYLRYRRSGVLR